MIVVVYFVGGVGVFFQARIRYPGNHWPVVFSVRIPPVEYTVKRL